MENPERRKRGDHVHNINRDKSKIVKFQEFDNNGKSLLEKIEIESLVKNFSEQDLKQRKYPEQIDITCPLFKKNNFILSPKAIEKCNKVYHYMIYQVPCILEGETGASKSFTASMMAQYRQWKINKDEKEEQKKSGRRGKFTELNFLNLI